MHSGPVLIIHGPWNIVYNYSIIVIQRKDEHCSLRADKTEIEELEA